MKVTRHIIILLTILAFINVKAADNVSVSFDFNNPSSLNPSIDNSSFIVNGNTQYYNVEGESFTNYPFTINISSPGNPYPEVYTPQLFIDYKGDCRLNTYPYTVLSITTNEMYYITSVELTFSGTAQRNALNLVDGQDGTLSGNVAGVQTYTPADNTIQKSLTLEYPGADSGSAKGITNIVIKYNSLDLSDIDNLNFDEYQDCEYYTLQGVKITNPISLTPGYYICHRGNKYTKILIK